MGSIILHPSVPGPVLNIAPRTGYTHPGAPLDFNVCVPLEDDEAEEDDEIVLCNIEPEIRRLLKSGTVQAGDVGILTCDLVIVLALVIVPPELFVVEHLGCWMRLWYSATSPCRHSLTETVKTYTATHDQPLIPLTVLQSAHSNPRPPRPRPFSPPSMN